MKGRRIGMCGAVGVCCDFCVEVANSFQNTLCVWVSCLLRVHLFMVRGYLF